MLKRLLSRRRLHVYLKFIGLALVAIFYFTFLFRESLNAIEQKKEKAAAAAAAVGGNGGANVVAVGAAELKLLKSASKLQQLNQPVATAVATAILIPTATTLNPVYEYSEEIHSATERDLQRRRDLLNSICQRYNLQAYYPPDPWEFLISAGHNLVWCNVFKAASSTWMYYFNILGGYDIKYLQRTEALPLELARKRFPRPELNELLDNLPSALSFLFVREPFERLVSAYRNKLEGGRNNYYKVLAKKIIRQFRHRPVALGGRSGRSGPTFKEFLHFLIREHAQKKRFDEHWAPVYSFCTPCSVNFTIIGKVETFQRDTEFIIRQAGLEPLLLGKLPRSKLRKIGNQSKGIKTESVVERYFADIDRNTLDQLLNIYRLDFELFDYNFTKYYDMVEPALVVNNNTTIMAKQNSTENVTTTTRTTTVTSQVTTKT